MTVYLRILGPLEVCDEHTSRKVGGVKERVLLTLLALHQGAVVSVDAIADALWGDDPPRSVTKGIPVLVTRLRKVLAAEPALPVEIERVADGYRLLVPNGGVDAEVAEDLARAGELAATAGSLDQAAQALVRAEALWRGASLADTRDRPFAIADAQRLDELRLALFESRIDVELGRGRHEAVLPDLEAACIAHPLRERLWAQRMLALQRASRSAEALRAFQDVRAIFGDELGLEPGDDLRALESAIVRDDPSLRLADHQRTRRLPTGEVTFLVTEVEGATKLWDRVPGSVASALARLDAIVAAVVGESGGVVLTARGEGDAAFCVLDDPVRAVNAAFDLQRAMLDEDWPADAPIRLVIAVHTGPAEPRDSDYMGPTVNRVVRLRDAGHGGQVLLSAATAALVRQHLPASGSLRDLGLRRLRDLLAPERIFQLEHPSLPSRFPPLQTLDARPNNLPVQPTSFVGRDDTRLAVIDLLRDPVCRLATLTGPGGIGKTRLALRVGADLIDDFDDGVWFVPLAPVLDPAVVPAAIATALGLRTDGGAVIDAVVDHLRSRTTLLVLDNFEHLLDAADLLPGIQEACPGLKVLATSREWLHLRGEHALQLQPLDVEAAGALFVDRARAARVGLDQLDAAAVAEVCLRVDGLPLAIELVAARLRQLTLDQLVTQFADVLDLAADGPRDQPTRQRTLRDTLAWSASLLDEVEQRALEKLSVFRGGWTLDAASSVLGATLDDTAIVLASLVDKSLIVQPTPERYDLLETVRAYATELLAGQTDLLRATRRAHVDHRVAEALAWFDRDGLDESMFEDMWEVPADLRLELDNLRVALHDGVDAGVDIGTLAVAAALLLRDLDSAEALRWVEAATPTTANETWRYWLLVAEVSTLWSLGRFDDVERVASTEIAFVERVRPEGLATMWNCVGIAQWRVGNLAEADASLRTALAVADASGDPARRLVLHNLGLVALDVADLPGATACFERALESARGADARMERVLELRLGLLATERGDHEEALRWCRPILASDDAATTTRVMAAAQLVESLLAIGDSGAALAVAEEAMQVASASPPSVQADAHANVAVARIGAGDLDAALDAAKEAERLARGTSSPEALAHSLRVLGRAHRARGDLPAAARALEEAVTCWGRSQRSVRDSLDLAAIECELGSAQRGWTRMVDVLRQSLELGRVLYAALACRRLAELSGDIDLAAALLAVAKAPDPAALEMMLDRVERAVTAPS